jgi:alkylation response protein AidB-like acyl-CoA dehydrogenase
MMQDEATRFGERALSAADAALIRAHAPASDSAGALTPELLALVHERGWLRMLAPAACTGAELALPSVVRLEEQIAAADGSTGWFVTLCAGAGWFAGFLQNEFARQVIGTRNACLGGSGAPTGFADIEGDGFRISGQWQIATGSPVATHFTMNAVIRKDGEPLLDNAGRPRVRAFIVPAAQVQVQRTWRNIGMRASGSHSFSVDKVWVGADHAFDIDAAKATAPGPLYRYPFASLAYVTIAANISGMALHFVDLAKESIGRRKHPANGKPLIDHPEVASVLLLAEESLAKSRARFYELLERSWQLVCDGVVLDAVDTRALHAASLDLVKTARRAVDELFPFCGLYAAHEESEIGRVWRDLHTGGQHAMLLPLAE